MVFVKRDIGDLPALDTAQDAHMQKVLGSLGDLIEANNGFIGFDDYMAHVLYAPGLGYYSAGVTKFGAGGDYVTAPLISSLFSQTLARFMKRHTPGDGDILELGAGTGVMAADILQALASEGRFPGKYYILELSADLRQRQQQTLEARVPDLVDRVCWLDSLDEETGFHGVIVANEVMDAMPVKRFVLRASEIRELGVGVEAGMPRWKEKTPDAGFEQHVLQCLQAPISHYPDGYCSEINLQLDGWIATLSSCLQQGTLLLIDYGFDRNDYYQPRRADGTLRGYYRHHAVDDPFFRPGLTDITAWVDFTRLAEAAGNHGLNVCGYTSQANFLLDSGLADLVGERPLGSEASRFQLAEEIKRLTLPGEMGETVKVMVLSKNDHIEAGFSRDMRYSL